MRLSGSRSRLRAVYLDLEPRSARLALCGRYLPAVDLDDLPSDGEPEPRPRLRGREAALEDVLALVRGVPTPSFST
jgi:hypothetical protein